MDLGGTTGLFDVLIWLVVAVVIGFVLFLLVSAMGQRSPPKRRGATTRAETAPPDDAPPADRPPDPLTDPVAIAMRLADQGRLVDAVRLLLRAAVDLLRARGHDIAAAETSREILHGLHHGAGPTEIFSVIVQATERALFRGEAIDRADVERCAESFIAFRQVLAEGPR